MKQLVQLSRKVTYGRLLTFLALALSACGEVKWQKRLPLVPQLNVTNPENRPSVFLEVSYLYDLGDGMGPRRPSDSRTEQFKALLEKVTEESALFSRIGDDPNDVDLRIKIDYLGIVERHGFISGPPGHVLGLPLGPVDFDQKWRIKATVIDRSQSTIGAYEIEDEVTVRLGAFGGMRLPGWADVFSEGLENMLKTVYQKMLDDKLLSRP